MYGLTEIYRDQVKGARLVANPGCYPTSVQLPLYPLLQVSAGHCSLCLFQAALSIPASCCANTLAAVLHCVVGKIASAQVSASLTLCPQCAGCRAHSVDWP